MVLTHTFVAGNHECNGRSHPGWSERDLVGAVDAHRRGVAVAVADAPDGVLADGAVDGERRVEGAVELPVAASLDDVA